MFQQQFWGRQNAAEALVLPLTGHVHLGKSLNLSESVFSSVKWERNDAIRETCMQYVHCAGTYYAPSKWELTDVSLGPQGWLWLSLRCEASTYWELIVLTILWWYSMVLSIKTFLLPTCHNKRKVNFSSPRYIWDPNAPRKPCTASIRKRINIIGQAFNWVVFSSCC